MFQFALFAGVQLSIVGSGYVSVPNDLTKIKSKLAFNLTKRQLICFGGAALIGIPTYLLTRSVIGNTAAMLLMIVLSTVDERPL